MQKPNFNIVDYKEIAGDKFKERVSKIYQKFVFAGYIWTRVASPKNLTYSLTAIKGDTQKVDLLNPQSILNKRNTYRQYLEAMFSFFYDYTILDINIQMTSASTFFVSFVFNKGETLYKNSLRAFNRPSGPAAYPLVTAMDHYKGTLFPLTNYTQFSSSRGLNKGMILCQYVFDSSGNPVSTHYSPESFVHGIPLMSLILTDTEYDELKKKSVMYDKYRVITDLAEISKVLGAGNNMVGSLLMWLSILIDAHAAIEHWTFNMAYDTDNSITCARRFFIQASKDDPDMMIIHVSSHVIGVLSEGIEAVLTMEKSNLTSPDTAEFQLDFCNGIVSERKHQKNLTDLERIVFENLFNDSCTFGWKLGAEGVDQFTGLLCIPTSSSHTEYAGTDFVKRAKFTIKYTPYFFCPDKAFAWKCRVHGYHKKAFGGRIGLDKFMYPIETDDTMTVYKSYHKGANNKYKILVLLSTKDYESSQPFEQLRRLIGRHDKLEYLNPLTESFIYRMITSRLRDKYNFDENHIVYSFIGSRLMVLETTDNPDSDSD